MPSSEFSSRDRHGESEENEEDEGELLHTGKVYWVLKGYLCGEGRVKSILRARFEAAEDDL